MGSARRRRRSLRTGAIGVAALLAVLAACTSEPPDPAVVRKEQVRARLEATFSDQQAECILGSLDEPTIRALAGGSKLDADSDAFILYSNVVTVCARGAAAPSPAATTTTTGPDTTTTTGG